MFTPMPFRKLVRDPRPNPNRQPRQKSEVRKPAAVFNVPAPRDVSPELGAALDRLDEIQESLKRDKDERVRLDAEINADKTIAPHPEVAALLGEAPSLKAEKRARVATLKRQEAVAAAALDVLSKRITALDSTAERAVCATVRPEVQRLLANLGDALKAVDVAHIALSEMLLAIEEKGVSVGPLGQIRPYWLGDFRDANRAVPRYLNEVREAGYDI